MLSARTVAANAMQRSRPQFF